jgi:cellobiose dehydrogenase (acceptor)
MCRWQFSLEKKFTLKCVHTIYSFDEIEKVFGWTDVPSTDGLWYAQGVYRQIAMALSAHNYTQISINKNHNAKHQVYGHPPFTIKHGLRDTPAKTFLSAMRHRHNFDLRTNALATQIEHRHGKASSVLYIKDGQVRT